MRILGFATFWVVTISISAQTIVSQDRYLTSKQSQNAADVAQSTADAALYSAGAISPLGRNTPFYCDAVVSYTTSDGTFTTYSGATSGANGNPFLSASLESGTDSTAAWNAMMAAATNSRHANPVGLSIESNPQSAGQNTIRLPNNCTFAVGRTANMPHGITVDGNNATMVINPGASSGPGLLDLNTDANGLSGQSDTTVRNLTVICMGIITASSPTYAGALFGNGNSLTLENDRFFNCPIGLAVAGYEYIHMSNVETAHNRVGRWIGQGTSIRFDGTGNGSGMPTPSGLPAIDNTWIDSKDRNNWINVWYEGAAAQREWGGTASYATVLPYLFGGPLPHWISAVVLGQPANGAAISCKPNATIPLSVSDPGGATGAELIYVTNSSGDGGHAYAILGVGSVSYTVPVITAPAAGCINPPVFTAIVSNMDDWGPYRGMPTQRTGSIIIAAKDLEAYTIGGHPSTGLLAYGDATALRLTFEDMQILQDTGPAFTHFGLFNGQSIKVHDNWGLSTEADPWDGTKCQLLSGAEGAILTRTPQYDDPHVQACDARSSPKSTLDASSFGGAMNGTGDYSQRPPLSVMSNTSVPAASIPFFANSKMNGVAPTSESPGVPSSNGIIGGQACNGLWRWDGSGGTTPQTRTYTALALCIGDPNEGGVYQSLGQTFGAESWTPAPLQTGGILGASTYPTAPKGACYVDRAFVISQDGHGSYCPVNGGTWVQRF